MVKFLYLFDFGEEWRFTVTFKKSAEEVAVAKVIAGKERLFYTQASPSEARLRMLLGNSNAAL
ncbi:hypothetical protein SAMN05443529_1462 [Desulfosporosinus hippei DSM 8344]|uniref:Uncharacterized protein n=2 Tax=Desulfosporosinus TaxID=79206 RepID=A0A1G8L7D3_9FIRM|nr:hypothetical protein SAMN05443529_1462 [Desulfosporosinus hippei DSM 8344]